MKKLKDGWNRFVSLSPAYSTAQEERIFYSLAWAIWCGLVWDTVLTVAPFFSTTAARFLSSSVQEWIVTLAMIGGGIIGYWWEGQHQKKDGE